MPSGVPRDAMTRRRRKPGEKGATPEPVGLAVESFLARAGLAERVEQAKVVPEWTSLVGAQIASVTAPQGIGPDGTLLVAVTTNAWMTELSLMEPELLRSLNRVSGRLRIRKIRWLLQR
jgi:predicted nucleic acid-binding Zn ribbon protein